MPIFLFKKMRVGSSRPTTVVLQFVDRLFSRVKDVLVQVGSLIFSMDLIILDFDVDPKVLFILGHLFLATERALKDIDVG